MALDILCGFEPGADDIRMWTHNTSATSLADWSAVTTTTSGLSPSDARRWMKAKNAGTNVIICRTASFTPDTYVWYVQRDLVIEGSVPGGWAVDYLEFRTDGGANHSLLILRIIRGSGTTKYKIEMRERAGGLGDLIGTTSELTIDTKYHFRIETDGTSWTLWINDTQEIKAAHTHRIDDKRIVLRPANSSGVEYYWAGGALSMSNSESDRPGSSDAEVHDFEVDTGGSESEAGWGDDAFDCSAGSTTAEINDIELDGSDKVNVNSFWCEAASDTDAETVDTVTKAFTSGHTIGGGQSRLVRATNVGAKTVTAAARIYDGTSGTNVTIGNIGSEDWRSWHEYFPNAPGGGAWNQSEADGLKIGMQNEGGGGNGGTTECAAIIFTLVGLGSDPPAVDDRRRLLAA